MTLNSRHKRAKVLFVNEREVVIQPVYVVYCSLPWPVLGHMEVTPANLRDATPLLPERLAELVTLLLQEVVCHAVGVANADVGGETRGMLYLRPNRGLEDDIIPILRRLTDQLEENDPERPEGFDQDDLMAELLNKQLFLPRPRR